MTQKEIEKMYLDYNNIKVINKSILMSNINIEEKQKSRRDFYQTRWKECAIFLGCHVAERVLSYVFKVAHRMPYGNKGFDFICDKGFKVDVKSSCLYLRGNTYSFAIRNNKIADYFLLIAFDNRNDLNPQRIWLIKGNEMIRRVKVKHCKLNELRSLSIKNNNYGLSKLSKYELTDKLKETIKCCDMLKSNNIK